ncbi:hypothetical protein HD553DRAFT_344501 [Filobasidium floriforme]|uniref:uncharacterized protein n=1 Tax=Filobasidium floriforme TaxID=5210 RepID=UPI001E8E9622|nr:uncharacterized protein HD553DRAFT_344501 [Filobasidium floriforme]KAH8081285.1 hypothetical protein HD553DRAFT_344501 [Filobasidium floriforme]
MGSNDEHLSETDGQGGTGMAAGMEDEEEEEEEEEMPMGTAQSHQETDDGSLVVLNEVAVQWSIEIMTEESGPREGEDEEEEQLEQPGLMLQRFDDRAQPDNDINEPDEKEDEQEQSESEEEQLEPCLEEGWSQLERSQAAEKKLSEEKAQLQQEKQRLADQFASNKTRLENTLELEKADKTNIKTQLKDSLIKFEFSLEMAEQLHQQNMRLDREAVQQAEHLNRV